MVCNLDLGEKGRGDLSEIFFVVVVVAACEYANSKFQTAFDDAAQHEVFLCGSFVDVNKENSGPAAGLMSAETYESSMKEVAAERRQGWCAQRVLVSYQFTSCSFHQHQIKPDSVELL